MTSKVEICSNALLLVGHAPIAAMDEGDRATLMDNLYDQVRRATIRAYPWNAATTIALLSPAATGPAFGFTNRFLLPGDCLRVLSITEDELLETPPYRLLGRYVHSDESAIPLTYVFDVEDPNDLDALCVDALCARLAMTAAFPLTKSLELQKAMFALYKDKLAEARAVDGQEEPPAAIVGSHLLNARRRR